MYDIGSGGDVVRKTIYLPDELAVRVDNYLKGHRGQTLSSLVQEALEQLSDTSCCSNADDP
jgi:predicted DNA-binding protein